MMSVSGTPIIMKNDTEDAHQTNSTSIETEGSSTPKYTLLEDGLFEGDLKISEDFIRKHYNFSSIPGGEKYLNNYVSKAESDDIELTESNHTVRNQRAAGSESGIDLWTKRRVPYQISNNIPAGTRNLIRQAMDHWEDNNCLRFITRNRERDYIEFNNEDDGCYSTSVGRDGGKQTINLKRNDPVTREGCEYFGTIVHEIGHAIGLSLIHI